MLGLRDLQGWTGALLGNIDADLESGSSWRCAWSGGIGTCESVPRGAASTVAKSINQSSAQYTAEVT